MSDVLDDIVRRRRADIEELGLTFGCSIPEQRTRQIHPFLKGRGVILEVKRASPSRGDIAPGLNAAECAAQYEAAGAAAISVLTERNYFKGSLKDLIEVTNRVDVSVLRKDFILSSEEVEISYRCGADAVLLIARLLSREELTACAEECERLGMTAFVELRLPEDIDKYVYVAEEVHRDTLVCGVNSRDLKDFRIDLLTPVIMIEAIRSKIGRKARVVFESGVLTPHAAERVGGIGFWGLLLGEAAAKNPAGAAEFVKRFLDAKRTHNSVFWDLYAGRLAEKRKSGIGNRPFIKICGLMNEHDALAALDAGADVLGFILSYRSQRRLNVSDVERIVRVVHSQSKTVVTCAVITGVETSLSKDAIELCRRGGVDVLQLHGFSKKHRDMFFADKNFYSLPHYFALSVADESGLSEAKDIKALGEPRYLIDSRVGNQVGGTGKMIDRDIVMRAASINPLCLSGGINPDNVGRIITEFHPELIDVSSGVEVRPGVKDEEKIRALFRAVDSAVGAE